VLEEESNGSAVNASDSIALTVSGPGSYSGSCTATASGEGQEPFQKEMRFAGASGEA
jgi:hypothetical protein